MIDRETLECVCRFQYAVEEAGLLALEYRDRGFKTIKTKVGGRDMKEVINMLRAIRHSYPTCALILDANGSYSAAEALKVLRLLHNRTCFTYLFPSFMSFQGLIGGLLIAESGLTPILYEQPVARDD